MSQDVHVAAVVLCASAFAGLFLSDAARQMSAAKSVFYVD